jgi:hypothetical protein
MILVKNDKNEKKIGRLTLVNSEGNGVAKNGWRRVKSK